MREQKRFKREGKEGEANLKRRKNKVSKDKVYGIIVFLISLAIIVLYTVWLPLSKLMDLDMDPWYMIERETALLIPVYLAMVVVFGIIAWIGWTMATTPPPAPIDLEELESWEEEEEEASEEEE